MSDFTLPVARIFPDGIAVGAYANQPSGSSRPVGTPDATAVVDAGEVTFEGVTPGRLYVAWAEVDSVWRSMIFVAGADDNWDRFTDSDELEAAIAAHADLTEGPHGIANTADIAVMREAPLNVRYPQFADEENPIQAALDAVAEISTGEQIEVLVPPGEYEIDNLDIPEGGNVHLNLTSALLKPAADQARSFIYAPETDENGSYYGHYPDVKISGGFIDPNGKQCLGSLIRLLFTEDLVIENLTVLDFAPPWPSTGFTGTWTFALGGRRGSATGIKIKRGDYGTATLNDGIHLCHGHKWRLGGDIQCGDDAFAIGYMAASAAVTPMLEDDPDPIRDVVIEPSVVDSTRGHALRVYVEDGLSGEDWTITDVVSLGLAGHVGQLRNGGIAIIDQSFSAAAGDQIRRIRALGNSLRIGSDSHDAVTTQAVWIDGVDDCTVEGSLKLADDADDQLMKLVYARRSKGVDLSRLRPAEPDRWGATDIAACEGVDTGSRGFAFIPERQRVRLFDDFLGDVIAPPWTGHAGTDGQAAAPAVRTDGVNGIARLVTGDDAAGTLATNGSRLESYRTFWAAVGGLVYEVRLSLSAITDVHLFAGLSNSYGSLLTPFELGAGDALTSHASDAVGFLFDTAADTDQWFAVGVKDNTDAIHEALGSAPSASLTTFAVLRVEISSTGVATFFINGVPVGAAMVDALNTADLLTPVVVAFSRGAASRTVDVDYVLAECNR